MPAPSDLPPDPSPEAPPGGAPRARLSPGALRMLRVVFVMAAVLVIGGGLSVALGGAFASVPVAVAAAVIAFRVYRAPVRA